MKKREAPKPLVITARSKVGRAEKTAETNVADPSPSGTTAGQISIGGNRNEPNPTPGRGSEGPGTYQHGIECPCGACAPQTAALREWERIQDDEPGASPEPPEWALKAAKEWCIQNGSNYLETRHTLSRLLATVHARGREQERAAAVHDCVVWLLSNAPHGYKHLAGRLDEAMRDHRKPKEGT